MESCQGTIKVKAPNPTSGKQKGRVGELIHLRIQEFGISKKRFYEIFILTGTALFLLLLVTCMLNNRQYTVRGVSMEPTLYEGDCLYYSGFQTYEYGDLIIFCADEPYGMIVKRVIGLPGDRIMVNADGSVVRNHILLSEDYIITDELGNSGLAEITVEDGMLFVLGDNRAESIDSRDSRIGQIPIDSVYGKVGKIVRVFS